MATSQDPDFELPHRGVYFPNWAQYRKGTAKFTANDVDPSMCTYLIVAFAKIENDQLQPFEWNDLETFKTLVNLKKKNPRLKILLAVGGWTLSNQVAALAASPDSLRTFIASAVTNLRKWELDGLDIDWEFPAEENKEQFSAMLKGIRIGFESEKRTSNQKRLALTTAVHLLSLGGYDVKVINRTCDVVNIMTYDLHGAWDPNTIGHHAPLYKGPFGEDSSKNVADVVKSWEEAGLAKNKIAVGIPFYGRGWNVSQPSECKLGGRGNGPISASRISGETGNWPFHEILTRIQETGDKPVYDDVIKSTYVAGKNFWIGYDDVVSVKGKAAWVKANHYGGVFAWEISQDDFSGIGGIGKFPLFHAIYDVLTGRDSASVPQDSTGNTNTNTGNNNKFHTVKPGDTAYNIATQYGMTLDQLKKLNLNKKNLELIHPGDKIVVGPQQGSSHTQEDSADAVHVVQAGDTAYNIAVKQGMTLDQLRKLNPGKGTMEMIHPGDKIVIGGGATGPVSSTMHGSAVGASSEASVGNVHVVQAGDTAYNIAVKQGMTLDQLRKLNPGKGTMEMIHPGDKIILGPQQGTSTSSNSLPSTGTSHAQSDSAIHIVQSGDTAYNIAMKNAMTLDELRKLNPGKGTMEMIHPGDKISIRGQKSQTGDSAVGITGNVHVVQAGDTAYNIAVKQGMTLDQLRKLNPGKGTMEMIHPGDKIVIGGGATGPVSSTMHGSAVGASSQASVGNVHVVQAGDTAYNIAVKQGMTLDQLRKLNPGKGTMEMIHPGDEIVIG